MRASIGARSATKTVKQCGSIAFVRSHAGEVPPSTNPGLREVALVAALLAAVTAFVMWPLFGDITNHFPVGDSDPKLNSWMLAWGADRLPHGLIGFWSPPIFYPYQHTLAYSEHLLGVSAVVAPVQWIFGNATLTYNIALLLSYVVAGTSSYVLARSLTGSRSAGLIAAFGFAFAPYRWAQLTHLQVLWTAWLPLALWALHNAFLTGRAVFWVACLGAALLQVLSSGYSAFQVAMAFGLVGLARVVKYGADRAFLRRFTLAALAGALVLSSMVVTYYKVWSGREPTPGDLVAYSADLATYLDVYPDLPAASYLPGVAQDEGHLFPGLVVVALTLIAFAPLGRSTSVTRWRWVYLAIAVAAVVTSLGPEPRAWGRPLPIPGVYSWLVSAVPLFDVMRVPARFGMLALMAFSTLAAFGAARLMGGMRQSAQVLLTGALCAVIVWDGYGGPVPLVLNELPSGSGDDAAYEWLIDQPPGGAMVLPMATLGGKFTVHRQFGALKHRHPIVDGVGRVDTPLVEWLTGSVSPLVVPDVLPEAVPFMRGLGVRYIVFRQGHFRDIGIEARLFDMFDRDETLIERARFERVVIWEIPEVPAPPEPVSLTQVPLKGLSISASENADRIDAAIDGDPNSRWLSWAAQKGTEWVAIDFDQPRAIARVDFVVHERSLISYPRYLEIVSSGRVGGSAETMLFRGPVFEQLGRGWLRSPHRPVVSIDVSGPATARLVIRQLGRSASWWAIDDLRFWERE